MALPEGVTTCTVVAGVPVTHAGGAVKTFVSIDPSAFLVHTATGIPLVDFMEELEIAEGVAGQFTLPHTDQAGFQDENGNAYTNWYYTAKISYRNPAGTKVKAPKTKVFQLATGQAIVDLDGLPGGTPVLPYSAPIATVTSVNGRTGPVTIEDGDLPERLSEPSLTATIDTKITEQVEPVAGAVVDAKIAAEGLQTGSTYADERRTIRADKSTPKGFTPTISSATGTVADMRADGGQILLTGGFAIAYTNDDFATFSNGHTFTYATTAARYLADGEILVAVNYDGATSTRASIWRSTGWATNPATATFAKVLEAVSATSWFTNAWSIDTYENIVIVAEYGPQGADNAARVWVSTNYGATWALRFNLGASADLRAHMHGVAYDKYWGRLWICNGDDVANTAIRYSDDLGLTWTVYHTGSHQPVTIMPMPDCILFSSDMPPNGIYRAMRLPGRKLGAIEVPYKTDEAGTLTVLGQRIYKRDDGSPALFAFRAVATASDVGRIVATQDGITFHEIWKDAPGFSVAGGGVISVVGPTAKKKLIATIGGTSRGTSKLISPDVDWTGTRRHAKSHEPGGSDPLDLSGLGAASADVGANVWISAAQFNATVGTSTKPAATLTDTSGGASFWTVSPSTDATLDASVVIPTSWGKVNIDLYWTEANAAGAGDVMWRSWIGGVADGASLANAAIGGTATATAPVYPTIKVTRLGAGVAAAAALQRINIRRLASQPTDTLTTNAYVFGVMLSKG